MAINLKAPKKVDLNLQSPIQVFQNPVEDFLAPMKQTKSDLEQKIAQISSWSSPTPIQGINESNWNNFQWSDMNAQNYQPQSLIDYYKTGKTTSELAKEWVVPSRVVPDAENPFINGSNKSNNPYEWAPWIVRWVGNFLFWTNPEDTTTSGLYKWAELLHKWGQALFENQVEWARQISDLAMQHSQDALNRGYSDVSPEKEAKIKQYIKEKLDAWVNPDIIKQALAKAKADWKLQWSWWDNPISGTLASVESGLAKWVSSLETWVGSMWSAPLQEDSTAGLVRLGKWAMETGLGSAQLSTSVMPTAMWAKALIAPTVNTLFSTETAGELMTPITEWIGTGIWMWQEALWYNPESSVSKDIQNIGSTVWTMALFAWAQKWGGKWFDFIKEKAPVVWKAVKWVVKNPLSGIKTSKENVTAKTEAGTEFTVEQTPTLGKNITDKAFHKENEILAQQSVFPKATKEKTTKGRLNSDTVALDGIKQIYEDKAKGNIQSDIHTMGWGVDWLLEAIDHHGKRIWEIAKSDAVVEIKDPLVVIEKASEWAKFARTNASIRGIVKDTIADFKELGENPTIADIQAWLSAVKNRIFKDRTNIADLAKTEEWRALNDYLKQVEDSLNSTIENHSWNSAEFKAEKAAYSRLMKIIKDLPDSYMVELRNQWKWITGTAWKVAGLYEVLSNPSISWILKAVALKQAGETMQYYKSRAGNWETLIRNLDREAVQRKSNPNTPKNDRNSKPSSSNMDNSKPVEKGINLQNIPWSKKTNVETPRNPVGNFSKRLAGNKWVIVEDKWAIKLLPSWDRMRKSELKLVENDLNSALNSKYNPNKPEAVKTFIENNITKGKITKEEAITLVEGLYEKANWFNKPHYEEIINDLYSNKKIESFDDLLNEKQVQKEVKTPRQEYLETPEWIYEEVNKKSLDRRYNPEKANALIAKFKEKTGIDLMKNPNQKFDEKWNVIKTSKGINIWKNATLNPIKNESKVSEPTTGDTIPDGYTKNAFGEIIKKPGYKKGGFIRLGSEPKKLSNPLVEEARKYKSADDFVKAQWDPIYHWSKSNFEQFDSKFTKTSSNRADKWVWTYFTDNKKLAQEYAKDNWYLYTTFFNKEKSKMLDWDEPLKLQKDRSIIKWIVEKYLEPNKNRYPEKWLIIDIEKSLNNKEDFWIIYEYLTSVIDEKELSKILNSQWFDWIVSKDYWMWWNVYTLFDANKIRTESQLKQIYEQANKKNNSKKWINL